MAANTKLDTLSAVAITTWTLLNALFNYLFVMRIPNWSIKLILFSFIFSVLLFYLTLHSTCVNTIIHIFVFSWIFISMRFSFYNHHPFLLCILFWGYFWFVSYARRNNNKMKERKRKLSIRKKTLILFYLDYVTHVCSMKYKDNALHKKALKIYPQMSSALKISLGDNDARIQRFL